MAGVAYCLPLELPLPYCSQDTQDTRFKIDHVTDTDGMHVYITTQKAWERDSKTNSTQNVHESTLTATHTAWHTDNENYGDPECPARHQFDGASKRQVYVTPGIPICHTRVPKLSPHNHGTVAALSTSVWPRGGRTRLTF